MKLSEKIKSNALFKKIDNFWYHYKVPALIFGVLAVFVIVCVVQTASREDTDLNVFYAGPGLLSEDEINSAKDALSSIMSSDFDGNGKKSPGFSSMCIMSDEQIEEALKNVPADDHANQYRYYASNYSYDVMLQNFYSEIFAGEAMIAFVDAELYELVKEKGGLYTLAEVIGEKPEAALDDWGIRLCDTGASFFSVFGDMPEDTVVCMRRPSSTSVLRPKEEEQKRYEYSAQMLKDIIEFSVD